MATMKDLLRAETLKVGSRGAMPSNQIIALVEKTNFTSPNGESVRYVAPVMAFCLPFYKPSEETATRLRG